MSDTSSSDHRCAHTSHQGGSPRCLEFSGLTLGYGAHAAVHGLSGTVDHGALLALVGPNGSGKSTLLKGIAGLLAPMAGSCVHKDSCTMAYLPQQAALDTSFPATVYDVAALGLWRRRGLLGRFSKSDRQKITQALEAVGLEGFAKRGIDTLSGGQLQRALFARVLVQDADLILLDEPFNAIDEKTIEDLTALIHQWHGEHRTVIAVMHDLDMVRANFPQCLLLSREMIAWGQTQDALSPANLAKARSFRAAWDDDAPWCGDHDHQNAATNNAETRQDQAA